MQGVAQHMRRVALGRARVVQHLDGEVEVLRTQLSHHGHQHIPGIIPANTPHHLSAPQIELPTAVIMDLTSFSDVKRC